MYDDYEEPEDLLDEELPKPPEDMKLSIEVSLTEYSPNGLLELIARGLLQQIGGPGRWKDKLDKMMAKMAEERVQRFVDEKVSLLWAEGAAGIDFAAIVRKAAEEYMWERVRPSGDRCDSYDRSGGTKRIEWLVSKLTKEAMDGAFKQAEAEWRASTQAAIKETIAETLAARLTKALPSPPELRG